MTPSLEPDVAADVARVPLSLVNLYLYGPPGAADWVMIDAGLAWAARDGRTRDFDYDAAGHFVAERWVAGGTTVHTIAYGYDADGRLTSAGDAQSQDAYTYAADGTLDVVTETVTGGPVFTFDYDANAAGDVVAVTVSVDGTVDHVEEYAYDADGRMTQVTQHGVAGGPTVAEERVDIAYADGRFGTITRYADW